MLKLNLYITTILFLSFSTAAFSQEIGEIYNSSNADSLFGKVIESRSISVDTLKNALEKTENYIMFRISEDNLTILGDNRILLYSLTSYLEKNEVFHVFSKNKVSELITISKNDMCYLENREKAFTITKGNFILDLSEPCPPRCP